MGVYTIQPGVYHHLVQSIQYTAIAQ